MKSSKLSSHDIVVMACSPIEDIRRSLACLGSFSPSTVSSAFAFTNTYPFLVHSLPTFTFSLSLSSLSTPKPCENSSLSSDSCPFFSILNSGEQRFRFGLKLEELGTGTELRLIESRKVEVYGVVGIRLGWFHVGCSRIVATVVWGLGSGVKFRGALGVKPVIVFRVGFVGLV
ncbi:hypothetical protein Drorol1_Dr00023800 [Drosera rotundifolia]